jgi:transposase
VLQSAPVERQQLVDRVAQLEEALAKARSALAQVTSERDKLRRAYEQLKEQLELLRRRIHVAKAERIDATQLQMEFAQTQAKLDALATQLDEGVAPMPASEVPCDPADPPSSSAVRPKPTGRRNLAAEDMPEERVEIVDPVLEGTVERIGFEESCKLKYRRGGWVRAVVARVKYKTEPVAGPEGEPAPVIVTAPMPKELFPRGLLAPSAIAHLMVQKYRWGLPFHRQSRMMAAQGVALDDGTMCRYAEHLGATLGCIVDAMANEARATAFCLSTDATGVCIQPEPLAGRQRQACRKGHFFVVLADKDHVFFEFQPKHTSAAVCEMFRGFSGYIQADAHVIYDAVFRGEARAREDDVPPIEVGCWSHCRRHAWEAAVVAKAAAAREALLRMRKLFQLEEQLAQLAPAQRHARRQLVLRPLVDDFFAWAREQFERVKSVRGLVAGAFGYAVRQEIALRRFLDDGRLPMTNNHSERALRGIAVGRRAWLFFGSDDHATAAANLLSLIASCELHGLDPETYLSEIIHLLPYWPRNRYLELAPKYWTGTRARIPVAQLDVEIGDITVPPPAPQEQSTTP